MDKLQLNKQIAIVLLEDIQNADVDTDMESIRKQLTILKKVCKTLPDDISELILSKIKQINTKLDDYESSKKDDKKKDDKDKKDVKNESISKLVRKKK